MASRNLGTLTLDLVARIGGFTQSMDQAARVVDTRMKQIQQSADRAKKAITGILTVAISGYGVKTLIDMADRYGQMADRIKMATASTDEYNQVQQRLLQTANTTYRPLEEAQELYIRTADSIKSLGYNTSQALDITDSFSYLLVTNSASADRANSAISALSKSIQTGKVSSDSWQSILAATPTIVDSIAQATNKTTAAIRKLGVEGKLSLSDLLEGLRKNVDENKKLADGMGVSLNDALIRFKNNLSTLVGEQNSAYGATATLSKAIDVLGSNINLLAAGAFVLLAGKVGAMTSSLLASTIAFGKNIRAVIQSASADRAAAAAKIQTLTATKRQSQALAEQAQQLTLHARLNEMATRGTAQHAAALNALAAARRNEVAANLKAVQATKALNAAQSAGTGIAQGLLGAFLGPAGMGLAVAGVAASWLLFRDNTDQANQALNDIGLTIDEVNQKLSQMTVNQAEAYQLQIQQKIDELKEQQKSMMTSLNAQLTSLTLTYSGDDTYQTNEELVKLVAQMNNTIRAGGDTSDALKQLKNSLESNGLVPKKVTDQITVLLGQLDDLAINTQKLEKISTLTGDRIATGGPAKTADNNNKLKFGNSQTTKGKSPLEKAKEDAKRLNEQLSQQIALYGDTSEASKIKYSVTHGELKLLKDSEKQLLINKAAELDQLNVRKEFKSLMLELRTDEEKIRDTTRERVQLLKDANIQGKEYADAMAKIAKASITKAPVFGGIDASVGGASGELIKVAEASKALEKWEQEQLDRQKTLLDEKTILEEDYAKNIAEIRKQSAERQSKIEEGTWSASLSMISSFTGDAADLFKTYAGESSAAYKTMFAISKAASIAQAIIAVELAANKAPAEMPFAMGLTMQQAIRASGYASIGLMAATSIAGMAHDGIDNIPKEGTWLLDKNERVLSPRQNQDLTQFLNTAGQYSGNSANVTPQVNIVVNSDGSGGVDSGKGAEEFGRRSFETIKQIARETILQEKRQGGLLDANSRRNQ